MESSDPELAELRRFARERVHPEVARHELPVRQERLASLLTEMDDLGLTEPDGGLWADIPRGIALLSVIAEHDVSVALALHQRALARRMPGATDLVVVHGHYGLGREALADWLAEREPPEPLADVYDLASPRVVVAAALPRWVLAPVWDGQQLRLGRWAAKSTPLPNAHGLDALVTLALSLTGEPQDEAPTAEYLFALRVEALASVALALAAVGRGARMARQFAAERQQGGSAIEAHAAVRELLLAQLSVLAGVSAELALEAPRPTSPGSVVSALALAGSALSRLCEAANAALQVFGGLGYMRDTGMEKIARDVNHLRHRLASPGELGAIAVRWEQIHG